MEHLHAWYDQIMIHIRDNGLINLSEYKAVGGYSPFGDFTNVTRSKEPLKPFSYSDFKHADESNFLSQDLMYVIAWLELLQPRINDVVAENGRYHQSVEDHLYLRYAGFGFQAIYSYWDRIGDILDLFFETGATGDVYLGRVLNNFPKAYRSATYDKLYALYKQEIELVLQDRHDVVHSFGLKAKHFWGTMEKGQSEDELQALQEEKMNYPTVFRKQLNLFFEGFHLTVQLISELPDKAIAVGSAD